jgi:hypothetical protein
VISAGKEQAPKAPAAALPAAAVAAAAASAPRPQDVKEDGSKWKERRAAAGTEVSLKHT